MKSSKAIFLILTILVAIIIPVLLQPNLNVLARNLFNPQGWTNLRPGLRVVSTLVCFAITVSAAWFLLRFSKIDKRWLNILLVVLTFLWTVFVAMVMYIVATD